MSESTLHDVTETTQALEQVLKSQHSPVIVPAHIKDAMDQLIAFFELPPPPNSVDIPPVIPTDPATPPPSNELESEPDHNNPKVQLNVKITRQTYLTKLYTFHGPNHVLEYPETSPEQGGIGYLFPMDLENWINPARNFVYSLGDPKGSQTKYPKTGKDVLVEVLHDTVDRKPVPCRISFSTCQGMKMCPFVDRSTVCAPHTQASREALTERLKAINNVSIYSSPAKDLFLKTLTYFTALRRQGCGSPLVEETYFLGDEKSKEEERLKSRNEERRGHIAKTTCQGRVIIDYATSGHLFVRCEHYNYDGNRDHFIDYNPGNGLLDMDYLEGLFLDDQDITTVYETDGLDQGIGPLASCNVVRNFTSVKVNCSFSHRATDNTLINPKMIHLECQAKFKVYEPLPEYRRKCPWALVVCSGTHTHPIPIPSKTPPLFQKEICAILHSIQSDIPDLTPRRFLRHPTLNAYLKHRLPGINNPMLLDLHPSLANRDHLRWYIDSIKEKLYPQGTGWEGLLYLQSTQCQDNPYIRFMKEYPGDIDADGVPLRVAICMFRENSRRLQQAHYLQSDIGFKRVVGFKEFELGALESGSRTTITYCRIYLNRQTAAAHQLIFHEIDKIVKLDTGESLKWRHIHSKSQDMKDWVGVFHFAGDQHGGQALGFGLYLRDIARSLPLAPDHHDPSLNIQDLDAYDHLRRIFRLCANHFYRNIQGCGVPETVKKQMRSLMCRTHNNWNVTLRQIDEEGGKPGQDWLADKVRAKFVFPAICWEKSCIPLHIWLVGDNTTNIIEQLHQDVNREGITCTLVGGAQKALHFDTLKLRTIQTTENIGIRPSHDKGTLSDSIIRSLQRQVNSRSKSLQRQDDAIKANNERLQKSLDAKNAAEENYLRHQENKDSSASQIERAKAKMTKALEAYNKALKESLSSLHTGSGKIGVMLPPGSFE